MFELVFSIFKIKHLLWFIRQSFCKNAFSVLWASALVECGDCRGRAQREEHGSCPLPQREGAGRLKSSLAHYKGSQGGYSLSVLLGGSDCDGRPFLIGLKLITHWPTGTSMAPCSPPPLVCTGHPPSLLPAVSRHQAGDPRALLSLSTQRLALQQQSPVTPWGGGAISSCLTEIWYWSPPAKDEEDATDRGEKKKDSLLEESHDCNQNEKGTSFLGLMG